MIIYNILQKIYMFCTTTRVVHQNIELSIYFIYSTIIELGSS